jgi:hypothetical protein
VRRTAVEIPGPARASKLQKVVLSSRVQVTVVERETVMTGITTLPTRVRGTVTRSTTRHSRRTNKPRMASKKMGVLSTAHTMRAHNPPSTIGLQANLRHALSLRLTTVQRQGEKLPTRLTAAAHGTRHVSHHFACLHLSQVWAQRRTLLRTCMMSRRRCVSAATVVAPTLHLQIPSVCAKTRAAVTGLHLAGRERSWL